jgi:competence protein ComEC
MLLVKPQEISNPGNPFEIDYREFMHQNGIWFSVYLDKGTYFKTGNHSHSLNYLAERTRDRLISLLTTAIPQREERSVVSALTLGYRTEIDQDTLNYFASTGAMHVLSVSGLHVALIYIILGFILSFLKRGKYGSVIFYIVMILFLWIYAFLTGFSPAVQRATVMFTFVILGSSLRRPVNIYNSLTASVLFLILLNPIVLLDIGFQLSYLAVLGIVIIQPSLNRLLVITNPFLKWCWSLFTVSVAAQIITFPLCLFYFNQFPNFFWLSGFAVIPITTLIIWMTLAFFVFSPIHGFALFIGMLIQKITYVMLYLLKAIDASPLAVTKGLVINLLQVYVLFGCISTVIIFLYSKKKGWLYATLLFFVLFQIFELQEKRKVFNQNLVWIYNTKNLMIHLINGRNNYLIINASENLSETELKMSERVCSHLKLNKPLVIPYEPSRSIKLHDLILKDNCLQFANSRISLIYSNKQRAKPDQIELAIYPVRSNTEPVYRTICIERKGPGKRKVTDFIREKAFYANLNRY